MNNDEFELYRARSFSAGAALTPKKPIFPTSRRSSPRDASVGRLQESMHDAKISDCTSPASLSDSMQTSRSAEGSTTNLDMRQRLERMRTPTADGRKPKHPRHPRRSSSCRRPRRPRELELDNESPSRLRTFSMPVSSQIKKPDAASLRHSYDCNNPDVTPSTSPGIRRVRSFSKTSKGGIINRGDSFKKAWGSQVSIASSGSVRGGCIRSSSTTSQDSNALSTSPSYDEEPPSYTILLLGNQGVGKSTIARQFLSSEQTAHEDISTDGKTLSVTIQLDEKEAILSVLDIDTSENADEIIHEHDDISAYVVVYSVIDRESFDEAVDVMYEMRKVRSRDVPLILVANKVEVVRQREVTEEEGKVMAVRYNSKYIEVSGVMNMNVDELLVGALSQIQLKHQMALRVQQKCIPDYDNSCMQEAARGILGRLFKNRPYVFRSCDNLMIL